MKENNKEKAVDNLENLLQMNSSNYNYYIQILEAHGIAKPIQNPFSLSTEDSQKAKEVLEKYE